LLSEIERHIRFEPFSLSPLILLRPLSMVTDLARPPICCLPRGLAQRTEVRQGGFGKVRVLIVDDHPIIVSGCRSLLEGEPDIEVIEAQDGAAGFAAFFSEKPDVGVVDINLPGFSGLELLRRILEREPEARLVIFSMNDDPTVAARAIEAGAKGYIAKNDDPALFADAIKTVANGGRYLHPEMARRIAFLRADPSPDAVSNLSPRELEILRLLAAGRTMAQIADLLNVSYKTIANNCTQLKQKLGARSAMDLMRIAIDARS
jgi:two-component system, NarL family, invasion response regulator UvrY